MDIVPLTMLALGVVMFALGVGGFGRRMREAGTPDVTLREDADTVAHGVLAERKAMLLTLIASTELDLATGKITEDVCERTLRNLKRETVAVMKQIEELGGTDDDLANADAALALAERRSVAGKAPSVAADASQPPSFAGAHQ